MKNLCAYAILWLSLLIGGCVETGQSPPGDSTIDPLIGRWVSVTNPNITCFRVPRSSTTTKTLEFRSDSSVRFSVQLIAHDRACEGSRTYSGTYFITPGTVNFMGQRSQLPCTGIIVCSECPDSQGECEADGVFSRVGAHPYSLSANNMFLVFDGVSFTRSN